MIAVEGRWLRLAAFSWATLVLAVGALTLRMVLDGERELAASDSAFDRGDLLLATQHARRAALAYAPGAPHVDRAYERLEAIAVGAESTRHRRAAERAWQAMREAALETGHLWVPRSAELRRADAALARLLAARREGPVNEGTQPVERELAAKLEARPGPSLTATVALLSSFVLVALGSVWVAARGVETSGRLRLGRAKFGLWLAALGAAIWTAAAFRL
jgi:hypothetical protein